MNLRPDERAALTQIEKSKSNDRFLKKGAGAVIGAATGLGASRVLPFLNDFIPVDLAIKGINKVSPKIGEFLKKGQSQGLDLKEGLDYIREQFSPKEESKPIDPLQDFETNYQDLASALARTMQNGQSPDAAAAILKNSSSFSKDIKKLEKETGKNFIDYILELFGNRGQSIQKQPMQQQSQPKIQQQSQPKIQQQPQPQIQQQQSPQQGSNVDAQLMAALDKILKM